MMRGTGGMRQVQLLLPAASERCSPHVRCANDIDAGHAAAIRIMALTTCSFAATQPLAAGYKAVLCRRPTMLDKPKPFG
jgi:hypothetical protein